MQLSLLSLLYVQSLHIAPGPRLEDLKGAKPPSRQETCEEPPRRDGEVPKVQVEDPRPVAGVERGHVAAGTLL